ncbi:hypothetical protein [Bacillus canaveralius]|uniref:hypothetical protein n=1 Tax=Bacillus canaveralius TaxID=1403243 RepID=UPI00163B52AE|nr:hypothetical protein [Bacillus canaveralius]
MCYDDHKYYDCDCDKKHYDKYDDYDKKSYDGYDDYDKKSYDGYDDYDKKEYDDYDKKYYDKKHDDKKHDDKKHYYVKHFDVELYVEKDHHYPCKPKKKHPKRKKKLICKFIKDDHYDGD